MATKELDEKVMIRQNIEELEEKVMIRQAISINVHMC